MNHSRPENYHPIGHASMGSQKDQLGWLYSIPEPLHSEEEWNRSRNLDLDTLSRSELWRELLRVRLRLLCDPAPASWLVEVRAPELERRVQDGG